MRRDEPFWWYDTGGKSEVVARLLSPFSAVYGALVERRLKAAAPYRSSLPVICVGNFTVGGTGKTPLSRFLFDALSQRQIRAACLTRGYGGKLKGPVWVDSKVHTARDVGDEPLLIAQQASVMVSADRAAGLKAIERAAAYDAVIMDDGLQNPSVAKSLAIALVDARRGFGNGRIIPSGPLRAKPEAQLGLVDCIVVMGDDPPEGTPQIFDELKRRFHGPVLRGRVEPACDPATFRDRPVLAFAGIANPERFFRLVESFDPPSVTRRAFPDHHEFRQQEAEALLAEARRTGADLVTTEKDLARLQGATGAVRELAMRSRALPITIRFDERDQIRLDALIDGVLKGAGKI